MMWPFKKKLSDSNTMLENIKKEQENTLKNKKDAWVSNNEFLKKQDACRLGINKKAFYGAYEDHIIFTKDANFNYYNQMIGMRRYGEDSNQYSNVVGAYLGNNGFRLK